MRKLKNRKVVRGISFFLAMIMVLSMMVAMTGCGKQDGKTDDTSVETVEPSKEAEKDDSQTPGKDSADDQTQSTEEPTPEPSTSPYKDEEVIPDDQAQKDKEMQDAQDKKDNEPTPEPTTEPTPVVVMPTLTELLEANKGDASTLDTNYKLHMAFGYSAKSNEGFDEPVEIKIAVDATMHSYENVTYNKVFMDLNYAGIKETMNEESYSILSDDSVMREYTYDANEDAWYVEESFYIDATGDEGILDTNGLTEEDFDEINVTDDGTTYTVNAMAVAGTDNDGATMLSAFGFDGMDSATKYTFKFDKETKALISINVTCTFNIDEEAMKEAGVESVAVNDFILTFEPNTKPITIPEDIINNAVAPEYSESITPPEEDEDELHKGWGNYYNSYCDEVGKFTMTYGDADTEVPVTLNAQDNWYFDNSWSFGTYLAVRDDSICDYEPAYEVFYGNSKVKVDYTNTERVVMALLAHDYKEELTSANIVPIIVNERQCYYLVSYQSDWSRTINVLQDIGFNKYVSIDISTNDVKTDELKLVEKFLLNFVYDGAQ